MSFDLQVGPVSSDQATDDISKVQIEEEDRVRRQLAHMFPWKAATVVGLAMRAQKTDVATKAGSLVSPAPTEAVARAAAFLQRGVSRSAPGNARGLCALAWTAMEGVHGR